MNWNWIIVGWACLATIALIIIAGLFVFMYRKVESITRDNGNILLDQAQMRRELNTLNAGRRITGKVGSAHSMTLTERQPLPAGHGDGRAQAAVRPSGEVSEYGAEGTRIDLFGKGAV